MYNVCEEEEEEKVPTQDQTEENDLTMGKMKLLRAKMENLTVGKKVWWQVGISKNKSDPKNSAE